MNEHIRGCPHHGRLSGFAISTSVCLCDMMRRVWRERDQLELQVMQVIRERDRARDIAVRLEHEIAGCPVLNHRGLRG